MFEYSRQVFVSYPIYYPTNKSTAGLSPVAASSTTLGRESQPALIQQSFGSDSRAKTRVRPEL